MLVLLTVGSGSFSATQSFDAFAMVVVGGLTSVPGAIAGAFLLRIAQYSIGGSLQLIVTGAGVPSPTSGGGVFTAPAKAPALGSQQDFLTGVAVGAGLVVLGVVVGGIFGRRR